MTAALTGMGPPRAVPPTPARDRFAAAPCCKAPAYEVQPGAARISSVPGLLGGSDQSLEIRADTSLDGSRNHADRGRAAKTRSATGRATRSIPESAGGSRAHSGAGHSSRGTDLLGRREDDPVLPRPAGVSARRTRREPGLPRLDPLLLRSGQPDSPRVLRLSGAGPAT